jgi:antibiotic biosynthesis monooxygenase (ABM) superfamily enzyme
MYGTVMTGRLAVPFEQVEAVVADWESQRGASLPGYVGQSVLRSDDGTTVVAAIRFRDRESYAALSDDPAQAEWWATRMQPCFDGEVTWTDGEWAR